MASLQIAPADPPMLLSSGFINSSFFRLPKTSLSLTRKLVLLSTSTRFVACATDRKDIGKLAKEKCNNSVDQQEWTSSSGHEVDDRDNCNSVGSESFTASSLSLGRSTSLSDSISLAIKEPVYEVIEVRPDGIFSMKNINRRKLLKSSGLRLRDIRSVDPSLWLTNSMPSLLVREQAILLNLGSLQAIAMPECVLVFDYNREGGKDFLELLLPRLNPKNINGGPTMPFELEVVEAALLSRIQYLERRLMDVEPRVAALLEVLPNRLTADILEQLRLSKQTLVELDSKAGDLKQMLLDLLEDPHEILRICIMGRNCIVRKGSNDLECSLPMDKQIAEEEEEEIEMLLENYLQRIVILKNEWDDISDEPSSKVIWKGDGSEAMRIFE